MTPGVLVELIDLDPEDGRQAWAEWYDRTYLAERARLDGVVAARRGTRASGSVHNFVDPGSTKLRGPAAKHAVEPSARIHAADRLRRAQNIVVYDLADVTVPLSSSWRDLDRRLEADDPARDAVRASLARAQSALYRQLRVPRNTCRSLGGASAQESLSTVRDYEPPDAEILHGAFFEADPSDHDEFNDWYDTEHVLFVDIIDGYLNCRRFQSLADPSKFLALYDVTTLEVATSDETAKANESPWTDRIRHKVATYRERRLFHIARVARG
jgi:hypothetical protein